MSFDSWLQQLRCTLARRPDQRRASLRAATHWPSFEVLEGRITPSLTWSSSDQYPDSATPAQQMPLFADFTGDGIPDRLTTDWYGVNVQPGRGDGTFGNAIISDGPTGFGGAVDDFNGDGRLDLFMLDNYSASAVLLLGRGDGTVYEVESVPLPSFTDWQFESGDFDGDGRPDVAIAISDDYSGELLGVMVGLNDGNWAPTPGQPRFAVSGFPSPITAGTPGAFTVAVTDDSGNAVTDFSGTVHFTSSESGAVLPDDYTFTPADQGVHTFSAILTGAGTQETLTAQCPSMTAATGSQEDITVNPAPASSLYMPWTYTSPFLTGVARSFSVMALDPYDNLATGYRGTVHFTSSDPQAALPPDYTFTAADAGTHTFSITLNTVGTQSFTASDTATDTITGSQDGIPVSPAASTFTVAGFPSPTTAGAVGTFTVTARDASGNTLTDYTGRVRISSSDAQAALIEPVEYTFTTDDQGVYSFYAILKTAGTQSLTVTQLGTDVTGTQTGITVKPAPASTFMVAGFPSPVTAGSAGGLAVTARDPYGNRATGYTGTVHFSSSDTRAALPGNYTFTAADAGTHSFSATLKTAASQSLTATDTISAAISGSQGSILVNPAAASRLVLSAPASIKGNTPFNLTVTVVDAYGNVVTGYRGTLSFSSTDSSANLPKNYTFTAADQGVHIFMAMRLKKKGNQTITVTDTLTRSLMGSAIVDVL
jgi:hypothetical protein